MNLKPPPTVADVPTFDRWVRESLYALIKKALDSGSAGALIGPDLAAIEALTGQGVPQRVSEGVWSLVQASSGSNSNIVYTGENRAIPDGTCSVLSTYVDIREGGTLEISSTGILDII